MRHLGTTTLALAILIQGCSASPSAEPPVADAIGDEPEGASLEDTSTDAREDSPDASKPQPDGTTTDGYLQDGVTADTDSGYDTAIDSAVVDSADDVALIDSALPDSALDSMLGDSSPDSSAADSGADSASDAATDAPTDADAGPTAPAWKDTILAPASGGGANATLVYDASGAPHALYQDMTDGYVRHAVRASDGTWRREIVDPGEKLPMYTPVRSKIDATGKIHLAWIHFVPTSSGGTTTELRYAKQTAVGWDLSTVGLAAPYFALDVDASGTPAIAYRALRPSLSADYVVNLARGAGGGWTTQEVSRWTYPDGNTGPLAVSIDAAGVPWVAFAPWDNGSQKVKVARAATGGVTVNDTPLAASSTPLPLSLAIDGAGTAHVFGGITHVFGAGAFWTSESFTTSGPSYVYDVTGALDASGSPIAVYDVITPTLQSGITVKAFELQVAKKGASGWSVTAKIPYLVGSTVSTTEAFRPALAGFDPSFRPALLGQLSTGSAPGITLTEFPAAGGVVSSAADVKERVRGPSSIAFDSSGKVRVGYVIENEVRVTVEQADGSFAHPYPAIVGASNLSLTVGADGRERIATVGAAPTPGNFAVLYRTMSSSNTWSTQSVATLPVGFFGSETIDTADPPSLAHDATGKPHIAYATKGSSYHLRHAAQGSSAWVDELVDPANLSLFPAPRILVNAAGVPFIGYMKSSETDFARWNGSVWQTAVVSSDPFSRGLAAVLDTADRPCIAHSASSGLFLTCLDAGVLVDDPILAKSGLNLLGAGRDAMGAISVFTGSKDTTSGNTYRLVKGTSWTSSFLGSLPKAEFAVLPDGSVRVVYFESSSGRLHLLSP